MIYIKGVEQTTANRPGREASTNTEASLSPTHHRTPIKIMQNFEPNLDRELIARAEIYTATKDLAKKIKNLKANHPKTYDDLNSEIKDDIDLNLEDATAVLYAIIGFLK